MENEDFPELYRFFEYTPEAFEERLQKIYDGLVEEYQSFDFGAALQRLPYNVLRERVRQFAPFNLTDGAWLQNIGGAGTFIDYESFLFEIWSDEVGNGNPTQNHSNVYKGLLTSLGFELPQETSRPFADDENFLDSAFTNPVFQLAISQFSRTFLPEIIGMTLWLEWESSPALAPIVEILERREINPIFYSLHVAIDNVSNGHGAIAKDVVQRFLDDVRQSGGNDAVQEQWKRIWTGFVTFATTGTLGEDLARLFEEEGRKEPRDRMIEIVARKAQIGAGIHDGKSVGGRLINDWFSEPERFVDALEASGYVNPGDPRGSRFLRLLDFDGPMYKVFSPEEINLIEDWIYSLAPGSGEQPTPRPGGNPADDMKALIVSKGELIASSGGGHHFGLTLSSADGSINREIDDWFQEPDDFLRALKANSNLVNTSDVENSRLLQLVSGGSMGSSFTVDEVETVRRWIAAGAPLPGDDDESTESNLNESSASTDSSSSSTSDESPISQEEKPATLITETLRRVSIPSHTRRKIWGQGNVN
ncbi:MAG: iron-containing redox enzyme family protein [Cyanothece sp. SIO1E1]|nr:iron-containing redox enzyme family protein [Cyanothece sp. SIO1E1]